MREPFTEDEKVIMDLIVKAHNIFIQLEPSHPDDLREWVDGVHKCQNVLMNRVVCRDYPHIFKANN